MTASADATLEALWEQVLSNWSEDSVHESFLEAATIANGLPFAATRYREEKRNEAHAIIAEKQLEKITISAMSMLEASRTPPRESRNKMNWVALGVSLALIASSIFVMTR